MNCCRRKWTRKEASRTSLERRVPATIRRLAAALACAAALGLSPAPARAQTPFITGLSPSSATAGGSAFVLSLAGGDFSGTSVAQWNGADLATTFVSSTALTAQIPASDLEAAGNDSVTVNDVTGTSAPVPFTVGASAPSISALSPDSAAAGSSGFTLTVSGPAFDSSAVVQWNGAARATTYVNGTTLTAAILASDVASAGVSSVTVTDAGGSSAPDLFTVANPAPQISSLSPSTAAAGGAAFTLTVSGGGFAAASVVQWNGNALTTGFVNATTLTAAVPASDIAAAGSDAVTVNTPAPGGGTSAAATFSVGYLGPSISSLSPDAATAGGGGFTVTVSGPSFYSNAVVQWNGGALATTFVNTTTLSASVPASDIAAAGVSSVTVTDSGGSSAPAPFTVANPAPQVASLSPSSATAGGAAFTLAVAGSGFVPASQVDWNGAALATTYGGAAALTAAVPATDLAAAGTATVAVANPGPGGGSASGSLTIYDPLPAIASISPSSAIANGPSFTLTLSGSGFVQNSMVEWNGNALTTSFGGPASLTAQVPASDIGGVGTVPVTVRNPSPGGGDSGAASFTVTAPQAVIASLSPSSATAGGSGFTLTVAGANFLQTSVVEYNGGLRPTTYVSDTVLTAAIQGSDVADPGMESVAVYTPGPDAKLSPAASFGVFAPPPSLQAIAPSSASAGGADLTLTANGGGFLPDTVVRWNGAALATSYESSGTLTAQVPSGDLEKAGPVPVTVFTPGPGGGSSNPAIFTVTAGDSLGAVLVYPNPWSARTSATPSVHFANLPAGSRVRVYSASGRFVTSVNGGVWDLANSAGQPVASGVYLYLVTAPGGGRTVGTLVVVR